MTYLLERDELEEEPDGRDAPEDGRELAAGEEDTLRLEEDEARLEEGEAELLSDVELEPEGVTVRIRVLVEPDGLTLLLTVCPADEDLDELRLVDAVAEVAGRLEEVLPAAVAEVAGRLEEVLPVTVAEVAGRLEEDVTVVREALALSRMSRAFVGRLEELCTGIDAVLLENSVSGCCTA